MLSLEPADKLRIKEFKQKLITLGKSEHAFASVECIFYDVLNIARNYGNETGENEVLYDLKKLQAEEYAETKKHFNKATQRERAISHFVHRLKGILSQWLKSPVNTDTNSVAPSQ